MWGQSPPSKLLINSTADKGFDMADTRFLSAIFEDLLLVNLTRRDRHPRTKVKNTFPLEIHDFSKVSKFAEK